MFALFTRLTAARFGFSSDAFSSEDHEGSDHSLVRTPHKPILIGAGYRKTLVSFVLAANGNFQS